MPCIRFMHNVEKLFSMHANMTKETVHSLWHLKQAGFSYCCDLGKCLPPAHHQSINAYFHGIYSENRSEKVCILRNISTFISIHLPSPPSSKHKIIKCSHISAILCIYHIACENNNKVPADSVCNIVGTSLGLRRPISLLL